MTEINDGGPAFPTVAGHTVYSHGMLLRDWFASQERLGENDVTISMAEKLMGEKVPTGEYGIATMQWWAEAEARYKYLRADAMLAAREKGTGCHGHD